MLELTFADGSTKTFPFGPDSQLSASTPDGANGLKQGSWGEITGLQLVPDADPAPVEDAVPSSDSPVSASEADASAPAEESPVAETEATPDPTTSGSDSSTPEPSDSPTSSDGSTPDASTPSDPPADPESVDATITDQVHTDAVTEANDAIVAVGLGTSDPDALAKALADVEAALETYPDSAELLDAKTQLTDLTATE